MNHQMRSPCRYCGHTTGWIETKNGQDCVYCDGCGRHCYNAPRTETGREVRSLRTRPTTKPGQRARILERDNATCVVCHRADVPLDVGHLISVDAGRRLGLDDELISHEENLAVMCQPCNSGFSNTPVPLRFFVALLHARTQSTPPDDREAA